MISVVAQDKGLTQHRGFDIAASEIQRSLCWKMKNEQIEGEPQHRYSLSSAWL